MSGMPSPMNVGIFREGTAERWVKRDLDTLLAPYRVKR